MSGSNDKTNGEGKSRGKELTWAAIIAIVLLALLGGGYLYIKSKHPEMLGGGARA